MSPLLVLATKNRRNRRCFTRIWKILWHQLITIYITQMVKYRFFLLNDRCLKF